MTSVQVQRSPWFCPARRFIKQDLLYDTVLQWLLPPLGEKSSQQSLQLPGSLTVAHCHFLPEKQGPSCPAQMPWLPANLKESPCRNQITKLFSNSKLLKAHTHLGLSETSLISLRQNVTQKQHTAEGIISLCQTTDDVINKRKGNITLHNFTSIARI